MVSTAIFVADGHLDGGVTVGREPDMSREGRRSSGYGLHSPHSV